MQLYDAEIGKNAAAAMAKSCVVGKGGGGPKDAKDAPAKAPAGSLIGYMFLE